MAEIIDNTFSMEPAPLVNTNEPMVEQPMVEPQGGEGDPVKKGGTSTTKDKTPKYDLDNGQLNTVANETAGKLAEFAGMVFKTTGFTPTYKGKPITDMSNITQIMSDGKAGQEIYKQALAALESPDLDEDSIASLYTKVYEIESGYNRTAAIKQHINKNQKIAANFLAAKTKDDNYKYVLNSNGEPVSEDDFLLNVINNSIDRSNDMVENLRLSGYGNEWKKQQGNTTSVRSLYNWIKTGTGKYVDNNPTPAIPDNKWVDGHVNKANPYGVTMTRAGNHHKQLTNEEMGKQLNDNLADGGYEEKVTKATLKNYRNYKFYKDNYKYDDYLKKIKTEYSDNTEIAAVKTLEEGVFKQGAANAKSSISSSFSFDSDDFLNRDDKGNILKIEDAGSTDKNANIFKKDFKNLYNLVDKTKSMEGAIIVSGSPEDYPGGVPGKTDDKVKATLNQFNVDLDEHIKTFFAHSKKLTATKLKGRPAGNVSFQPIASGNENYQAYHITFSPGYANKYAESEKKQKEHPEYAKGLTIFVPKEKAGETRIGAASLRGTHISNTEAAINMSADNSYRFSIPGGGSIEASKIGDSVYTITGNNVVYNLQNGKYDTLPINAMKYEVGASMAVDMDTYIKRHVDTMIMNKVNNVIQSNYHKSKKGVTDPNLLKRN